MVHAGTWAPAFWPQHPEPLFALAALSACMLDGNVNRVAVDLANGGGFGHLRSRMQEKDGERRLTELRPDVVHGDRRPIAGGSSSAAASTGALCRSMAPGNRNIRSALSAADIEPRDGPSR
jgi:hypothetical protein